MGLPITNKPVTEAEIINKSNIKSGIKKLGLLSKICSPLKIRNATIETYTRTPNAFIKLFEKYSDFFIIFYSLRQLADRCFCGAALSCGISKTPSKTRSNQKHSLYQLADRCFQWRRTFVRHPTKT